jgi:hypothetical protein
LARYPGFAAALAFCTVAGPQAAAQDVNDGWRVRLTPFVWAPAYDNHVLNAANGYTSDSSASFLELLEHISGVFLGQAEIQYKRAGVTAELVYLKLTDDRITERPVLGPVETEAMVANLTATATGFYRAVETSDLNVDLLAGFRYVGLDLDFDVQDPGRGFSADGSGAFTEIVFGVRATKRIGGRTSLTGYGDYGGLSDDNTVWQLEGTVNYEWSTKIRAFAGYRHFAIGVERGPVRSDVRFSGPIFGAAFRL